MAMPTPTIVADVVIKTRWAFRRSRLYYQPTANPQDEVQLQACANAIFNKFGDTIPELLPDEHFYERVECRFYGPGESGFFANSSNSAINGALETPAANTTISDVVTATEDILPDEASLIIQKKTGKVGRSRQGRLFLTGLSERVQYGGEVSKTFVPQAKNFAALIADSISVNSGGFVATLNARHYDRKNSVMHPITKTYVVNAIGSRRDRRKPTPYERL